LPWASIPTPTIILTPIPTPTSKPKDVISPLVSITNPLNNATVIRNTIITLKASASDNVAVSKVEFYYKGGKIINNSLICSDRLVPYTCSWTVPNTRSITYTITAKAHDTSNNTSSTTVKLNVK
jgi:cellulose 1,4-beta-cellobiosidase